MSNNLFDTIYDDIVARIKSDADLSELIKPGNVVEYSQGDKSKRISTTADFPKVEVTWDSLAPIGGLSNAQRYDATFRVTVATGQCAFPKMTRIILAMIRIADSFRRNYTPSDEDGHVYGCTHNAVTVGKFQPERGADTIHGWAFRFNITFGVCLKNPAV